MVKPEYAVTKFLPRDRNVMRAMREKKFIINLNDEVEKLHDILWDDDEYYRLLEAVEDAKALEGATICDDVLAAQKIKVLAAEQGNMEVASTPLASIIKALRVVLRRYGLARTQRRTKLHGTDTEMPAEEMEVKASPDVGDANIVF